LELTPAKKAEHISEDASTSDQGKVVATSVNHASFDQHKQVLLATAIIKVMDKRGREVLSRALLDSGSQSCFVTSSFAKRLALDPIIVNIPVCGLGEMSTQTNKRIRISLQSRINNFKSDLKCLVIDRITQVISNNRINVDEVQVPEGIALADSEFYKSLKIDLLLGAEILLSSCASEESSFRQHSNLAKNVTRLDSVRQSGNSRARTKQHNLQFGD